MSELSQQSQSARHCQSLINQLLDPDLTLSMMTKRGINPTSCDTDCETGKMVTDLRYPSLADDVR